LAGGSGQFLTGGAVAERLFRDEDVDLRAL
jgi:hypothetical protein